MNSRHLKQFALNLQSVTLELHRMPLLHAYKACHGNFGPAKKLVRGTKIPGIMVRPDHFPMKDLVRTWNNSLSIVRAHNV